MVQRITVVGAGVSGRALALFAARRGARVFVTDCRDNLSAETEELFKEAGVSWETRDHTERCCECDLMVVSSGISPRSKAVLMAKQTGIPVQGELDFLAPSLKGRIIAVTGTNGKTTCTSLIGHILKSNGVDVAVVGNIGEPLAAHAGEEHEALVMELSSFQLHWNSELKPDVAVLTNLAPDHIDWHGSYENYIADKCKIFVPRAKECYAIVQERDAFRVPEGRSLCTLGKGPCHISIDGDAVMLVQDGAERVLFQKNSLKLLGAHNLENAAMSTAAVALAFPDCDPAAGLEVFHAPRHRCEKVAERAGVLYVDDSKGTNVASVITALRSIPGSKIVILGGQGKGESYDALADAVKEQTIAAIVLGSEAERIIAALDAKEVKNVWRVKDMSEAVQKASEIARPGDCVLLSPACTSWDMYNNYEERGDHFAALVRGLPPLTDGVV